MFFTANQGEQRWNIIFANSTVKGDTLHCLLFVGRHEVHHTSKCISF